MVSLELEVQIREVRLEPFLPLWHLDAVVRMIVINAQVDEIFLHLVDNFHTSRLVLLCQSFHVRSVVEKCCFLLVGGMLT